MQFYLTGMQFVIKYPPFTNQSQLIMTNKGEKKTQIVFTLSSTIKILPHTPAQQQNKQNSEHSRNIPIQMQLRTIHLQACRPSGNVLNPYVPPVSH